MKACKHLMEMLGCKPSQRNKRMMGALNSILACGGTVLQAKRMSVIGVLVQGVMI